MEIIIRAIIFVVISCFIVYKILKDNEDELTSALALFLTGMISFCVFMMIPYFFSVKYDYQFSQRVVAMQDNQTYIISRHRVDSTINYYYMIEYGNGYISQIAPQSRSIIYTTKDKPEMKYYKEKFNNQLVRLIWGDYRWDSSADRYEFYIPEGSIKQDFNIDLK